MVEWNQRRFLRMPHVMSRALSFLARDTDAFEYFRSKIDYRKVDAYSGID